MLGLKASNPVPAQTIWLVRSWEQENCYVNPIKLLNETLEKYGRGAYLFLIQEMFRVLRKRFGTQAQVNIHIVVRPGFWFAPYPAIRPGEDTMQLEGNAIIHPVAKGGQISEQGNSVL